jgi:hypothetical protein
MRLARGRSGFWPESFCSDKTAATTKTDDDYQPVVPNADLKLYQRTIGHGVNVDCHGRHYRMTIKARCIWIAGLVGVTMLIKAIGQDLEDLQIMQAGGRVYQPE